jgi:hypothetical protein
MNKLWKKWIKYIAEGQNDRKDIMGCSRSIARGIKPEINQEQSGAIR